MILIADSGSTKTQWALIDNAKIDYEIFSSGINPFYQTETEIQHLIDEQVISELNTSDIDTIFFYGAGCAFRDKNEIVHNALRAHFENAKIEINSDLLGAARSLFQHSKGIACILGTGSNSCYYNGSEIEENVSPLGYILGDEGSAAVLAKRFVADCLKNKISDELKQSFLDKYQINQAVVLENVYKKPFPNRYLAQFTPFLSANIHHPEIYNLVYSSFVDFFERNVQQYNFRNLPTSFVGSVAHYFKPTLAAAAEKCNIKLATIQKSPIEGLVRFHS